LPDKLGFVLIASYPCGPWQANCYVLKDEKCPQALVVDAGMQSLRTVVGLLARQGWGLAGVLATHGHVDHIGDAARLANRFGVPMWLHGADGFMLTKPSAGLGPGYEDEMRRMLGADELPAPDTLIDLADCPELDVAGLHIGVTHAPGHSPGCVLFSIEDEDGPIVFSGDVVFAGSIGRTDLPGGDPVVMAATLGGVVAELDDRARLLPGHGPATDMARERATNPYLQAGFWEA